MGEMYRSVFEAQPRTQPLIEF